jgi:hypothetical protein
MATASRRILRLATWPVFKIVAAQNAPKDGARSETGGWKPETELTRKVETYPCLVAQRRFAVFSILRYNLCHKRLPHPYCLCEGVGLAQNQRL